MTVRKPLIISMSGKLGSGKDTFVDYLVDEIVKRQDCVCRRVTFATYFKKTLSNLFNVPINYFYDREKKEEIIPGMEVSPRELMIRFSDFIRGCKPEHFLDEGFYRVSSAFEEMLPESSDNKRPIVVLTDTRMPKEFDRLGKISEEGITDVIRILVKRDTGIDSVADAHESETTIDAIETWDYTVYNNGTLENLRVSAAQILEHIIYSYYD